MSFLAKMEIDGEVYNILNCTYTFSQPLDNKGKPSGTPYGGQIIATIESNGKTDLLHWMVSPDQHKNGSIIYYKRNAMSRLQELKFEKAFCVKYTEDFHAEDDVPMQIKIVISAQKIIIGDMEFENRWS